MGFGVSVDSGVGVSVGASVGDGVSVGESGVAVGAFGVGDCVAAGVSVCETDGVTEISVVSVGVGLGLG